jgi:hypothetical protein
MFEPEPALQAVPSFSRSDENARRLPKFSFVVPVGPSGCDTSPG